MENESHVNRMAVIIADASQRLAAAGATEKPFLLVWEILRKSLNLRWLLAISLFVIPTKGLASTLLIFDKPNFVAVKAENGLTGYYVGKSNQSRIFSDTTVDYPCVFFIKGVEFDDPIRIRAFPKPMKNWDDKPYTEGTIVATKVFWHVLFSEIPKGCQSKPDGEQFLAKPAATTTHEKYETLGDQGASLKIVKSETAIGIMMTKRRTVARLEAENKFPLMDFALPPDEIVVVLKKKGKFSLVRHVSADGKQVRRFWLNSTNLSDPYPK
jgi:hypothetical protein